MADNMDRPIPEAGPSDDYSFRSRASSIISTGTKTSLAPTFLTTPFNPQPLPPPAPTPPTSSPSTVTSGVIDVLLGRRNFRISARPGSILSISSFDVPAPPYSEALNSPAVPIEEYASLAARTRENATPTNWSDHPGSCPLRPRVQIRPSTAETESAAQEVETETTTLQSDDHDQGDEPYERTATPPSPPLSPYDQSRDTPNALSAHYTNIVRTIDSNHRAEVARLEANHQAQMTALQSANASELDNHLYVQRLALEAAHESKLAATRNDIDGVYRGEFARMRQEAHEMSAAKALTEQLMEQVKLKVLEQDRRIKEMEANAARAEQVVLEKIEEADERERVARNEVEDVWERRWKDRMNLAAEQVGKADREVTVWMEEVERRWPGEGQKVDMAVSEILRREEEEGRKVRKGKKWASLSSSAS